MSYEAWRITYQSSEQAARAAYHGGEQLAAENERLKAELSSFQMAVSHVTADGKTKRTYSTSEGWAMVHKDYLDSLRVAEEELAALRQSQQAEPDAWMFYLKVKTPSRVKAVQVAAIDYIPANYEEILRKEPLYLAPQPSQPNEDARDAALKLARSAIVQWHMPENRYAAIEAIDAVTQKGNT